MNLVCFPNYTCGAILCDILNIESSQIGLNNNFYSANHNRAKIKKVNNYDGTDFNPEELYSQTNQITHLELKNKWIGTHCWPGMFDTARYSQVINITTSTRLSRIYRYARIFYTTIAGKFPGKPYPHRPNDIHLYNTGFKKIESPNTINIEFEDWVNLTCEVETILLSLSNAKSNKHFYQRRNVWLQVNDFLYDQRFDYIVNEWNKIFINEE